MQKKETIPSYKRRLNDWDYSQPRIYMLTLAIEGRQPLLGVLVGDASQPTTAPNGPRLLPSELGAAVLQEVDGIPHYYPQITIITRQLMPDHLHILLYVTRPLPVHLGQVVSGFKAGCNKKWRLMQEKGQWQGTQGQNGQWQGTQGQKGQWQKARGQGTQWQNHWAPDEVPGSSAAGGSVSGSSAAGGSVSGSSAAGGSVSGSSAARGKGLLWEQGYHDRVLSGEGQLQRLVDYIRENPRRSLVRRQHADWFRPFTITAAGTTLYAFGNLELLHAPKRQAVRISTRITEGERNRQQHDLLSAARQGTVLISPFISTGERFVEETSLREHLPIVKLLPNGFSPYYKPQGHYFDACSEGRLLLLTPYPYSTQKVVLTRAICNYLNVLASRLDNQ